MAIIETKNLSKRYKEILAVDRVNLEIEEGECFGLMGPNGAGKTTLIRMITAVSPPTGGDIYIMGSSITTHARQIKASIGVVPQLDNLDPDLSVLKNLLTFARYFNIPKKEAYRRSIEVLRLFQLEERSNSRIDELSGGMKRRLLIARALINEPKIIVLDEPTIGLDPQAKYLVWQKLGELKSGGVTQLLPTQNMEEALALCDRVAIMNQGKILCLDTPQGLISTYSGKEVWEIGTTADEKEKIKEELENRHIEFDDVGNKIHLFHIESIEQVRDLLGSGEQVWRRPATLEDVFFRLTGRSLTE
jgi:lipooligosaccharide transport system ATP-binding protein